MDKLPPNVRENAEKNFELLKQNSFHPALHFKKFGEFWSARVNIGYRALAVQDGEDFVWFWIGSHREYERLVG